MFKGFEKLHVFFQEQDIAQAICHKPREKPAAENHIEIKAQKSDGFLHKSENKR